MSDVYKSDYEYQSNTIISDPKSLVYQNSCSKWDAGLSWKCRSGTITVSVFGDNIRDEDTIRDGSIDFAANRGYTRLFLDASAICGAKVQCGFLNSYQITN